MALRVHRVVYLDGRVCKNITIISNITGLRYIYFLYNRYNVTVLCNRRRGEGVKDAPVMSTVLTAVTLDIHARVDTQDGAFWSQL